MLQMSDEVLPVRQCQTTQYQCPSTLPRGGVSKLHGAGAAVDFTMARANPGRRNSLRSLRMGNSVNTP
jgi:hypothetical protein